MAKTQKDNEKTAGADQSKTSETTAQAAEREDALKDAKVEERGETDAKAAASGGSVGAVKDGDVVGNADDENADVFNEAIDEFEDGSVSGALGTVAERNVAGDEYDTPWTYLTVGDPDAEDAGLLRPRTSDSDDPAKSWTSQDAGEREDDQEPVALVPVQGTPGQTFRVSELPNRAVAEAAGIDYDQWVAGLPVRADVPDEAPRRGIPA